MRRRSMNFLGKMSIRSKILLIIGMAIFFQAPIALTGLYYINQTNRHLKSIVNNETEAIKNVVRINGGFRELIISKRIMSV